MAGGARDLAAVAADAARCRACPLWEPATQPVFGEGPAPAPLMLVGEQPGDQEDIAGRPFDQMTQRRRRPDDVKAASTG